VAVLQGRFHYYEGYSTKELTFPLRALSLLGTEILVVTNAAGGLDTRFSPGTIMVIRDHLNFIPDNPLRGENIEAWGPRFPDLSEPYDRNLIDVTMQCAKKLKLANVTKGVYVAIPGPSLETPAETRFLRNAGADAVGMSSVPEVIVAKHAGMKVLGLSAVANVNDPDNFAPILLDEIIQAAQKIEPDLQQLIREVLRTI
jgi:purine-nucleoside phosphorylase